MNRIRELRKQMDMTQKELAKHLKIADSTLSYWEMGRYEPDNDALMKLSRFFQVPIDYILGGDFTKWDIHENKMQFPNADNSHSAGSDIYVAEHRPVYRANELGNAGEAFNRVEFEGLTQGEIDLLAEYAAFIKSRRSKG